MKYAVLLCDGMADMPCPALSGKTPMEAADKPWMDSLAAGETGLVKTVPDGMEPGSDVANLTVMGYDTRECYTGRSPLEAANIGIHMEDHDLAFRCNLVTLSGGDVYEERVMEDYCAGDIHTEEAAALVDALRQRLGGGQFDFYTGTAYRHCMISHGGSFPERLTPPHDITGKVIGDYLPQSEESRPLMDIMKESTGILSGHPVNRRRIERGLPPANAAWLWGQGKRPKLPDYREMLGVDGAIISAVDLLAGIGRLAGMHVCEVEGATGYIDTNYENKTAAALEQLRRRDFVYIHIEAPDECGHRGQVHEKVRAIEDIDRRVLGPLISGLNQLGEAYRILILPDHPTPLALRTHTSDPVPYLLYDSRRPVSGQVVFSEVSAGKDCGGIPIEPGYLLIRKLFSER